MPPPRKTSTNPFDADEDKLNPFDKDLDVTAADSHLTSSEGPVRKDDFDIDEVELHIQQNLGDGLVQKALQEGQDLRNYAKQIEKDLRGLENASIRDYLKESENIAHLHFQISECDCTLEALERLLSDFQTRLGSISCEIQALQRQSVAMTLRLKNRQAVRGELCQFVADMHVPESLVRTIVDGPVTDPLFLEQLHELNHKIEFARQQKFHEARSVDDVQDILEALRIKSVTKIRTFLLQKIIALRKPMGNYPVLQESLLKHRFFFEFLLSADRHTASEIQAEYLDTASKVLFSYFKSYHGRLMKLQFDEKSDKDDVLGAEDRPRGSLFSMKPSMKQKSTIFCLGERGRILGAELEAPCILPHAPEASSATAVTSTKFSFETIFRSLHFALLDNACREHLFLQDFFLPSGQLSQELFHGVFAKTLTLLLKSMDTWITECFDVIALILSIHIVYRYKMTMNKRGVASLDKYWDTLLEFLWPRFEHLLHSNIQSIREVDPAKLSPLDPTPHYITRRYAEFCAALSIAELQGATPRAQKQLETLRGEINNLWIRMAGEFSQRRMQLVFIINNAQLVTDVLQERLGNDDCPEMQFVNQLLAQTVGEFSEEILQPHFGALMAFVKEAEIAVDRNHTDKLATLEQRVPTLCKSFAAGWKKAFEQIQQECLRSFSNFKSGTGILQTSLSVLVQYYARFQKTLSTGAFKNAQGKHELVNMHHIMVECKKYKAAF